MSSLTALRVGFVGAASTSTLALALPLPLDLRFGGGGAAVDFDKEENLAEEKGWEVARPPAPDDLRMMDGVMFYTGMSIAIEYLLVFGRSWKYLSTTWTLRKLGKQSFIPW